MSMLVDELRKEHQEIYNSLASIKDLRFVTQDERNNFLETKEMIISHLARVSTRLYPPLREAAKYDHRLENILDVFACDQEITSDHIMQFFERYSSGIPDSDFSKEYGRMIGKLKIQMKKEEMVLFNEYDRIEN